MVHPTVAVALLCLLVSGVHPSKVLLILIDGLRWDYLHESTLNGFDAMMANGVRADFLTPVFPSSSYPNYFSIMTGLYPENNGVISNYMYDPRANQTFLIGGQPSDSQTFWYDQGEPLWVTAAKQGKGSYWYQWPGCEAKFQGVSTYCEPYNMTLTTSSSALKRHLLDALDNLENATDLAGVYYERVDAAGHIYGPYSPVTMNVVKELDGIIDRLQNEIKTRRLEDELNVIIFSDHGMTEIDISRVVNITHFVSEDDLMLTLNAGAVVSVWPAEGKTDKVYDQLKNAHPHLTAFRKNDIPDRFNLRRNDRTPPLLLLADKGWYITTFNRGFSQYQGAYIGGAHGYDNDISDMRGIFTARGPDFRSNFHAAGFPNVDIYQLLCEILDVKPAPNNGTWDHVSCMLANPGTATSSCPIGGRCTFYNIEFSLFVSLLIIVWYWRAM